MQVKDLSHPKSSITLNEGVARQYGYRLNIGKFTDDQLVKARDALATKLAKFETSNQYDAIYENAGYHRDRALLDVITQALNERTLTDKETAAKEKFAKKLGSGKIGKEFKKRYGKDAEQVKHATATKMAKSKTTNEAIEVLRSVLTESLLNEGEEEKAALIMASRDMVDKMTGWLEQVSSMKAENLIELVDSIRYELGSDVSAKFDSTVRPALEEVYSVLESNRKKLSHAVSILTGEETPFAEEGAAAAGEVPALPAQPAGQDMGAPAPTPVGGDEMRAKRESIEYSRKLGVMLNSSSKKN